MVGVLSSQFRVIAANLCGDFTSKYQEKKQVKILLKIKPRGDI